MNQKQKQGWRIFSIRVFAVSTVLDGCLLMLVLEILRDPIKMITHSQSLALYPWLFVTAIFVNVLISCSLWILELE
jgi:hypothetical protein